MVSVLHFLPVTIWILMGLRCHNYRIKHVLKPIAKLINPESREDPPPSRSRVKEKILKRSRVETTEPHLRLRLGVLLGCILPLPPLAFLPTSLRREPGVRALGKPLLTLDALKPQLLEAKMVKARCGRGQSDCPEGSECPPDPALSRSLSHRGSTSGRK